MLTDRSEPCCGRMKYELMHDQPTEQIWVAVCPSHGHRVGSEVILPYPGLHATTPAVPRQRPQRAA